MIQALRDDVIVKLVFKEHLGKIVIPKSAMKFKQYDGEVYGEVVAVGPKFKYDLKPGDKINFQRHEGKPIWVDNEKYLVLREKWVLGVVNNG